MKYLLAILAALALLSGIFTANARGAEAKNIAVHDGDTFTCDIWLGFDQVIVNQTVRIYGFDAWEITKQRQTLKLTPKQWEQEIAKGKIAKIALESALKLAKQVTVHEVQSKDPYGRRLLEVYADGKEVGELMRAKGHERK